MLCQCEALLELGHPQLQGLVPVVLGAQGAVFGCELVLHKEQVLDGELCQVEHACQIVRGVCKVSVAQQVQHALEGVNVGCLSLRVR